RFLLLDDFPRTPTGKIDRKALPEPSWQEVAASYEAPRTATERRVAALWEELLGVPRVGRSDDFFSLGGHSLLTARLVARLRAPAGELRGMDVPLRIVFERPVLAHFAQTVDAAGDSDEPSVPLVARPTTGPELASFGQARLWFLHALDPDSEAYH